jgi:hypothetical protein
MDRAYDLGAGVQGRQKKGNRELREFTRKKWVWVEGSLDFCEGRGRVIVGIWD